MKWIFYIECKDGKYFGTIHAESKEKAEERLRSYFFDVTALQIQKIFNNMLAYGRVTT